MPFDGTKSQLALDIEKLRFVREKIADKRNWCAGSRYDRLGRRCLMGWLDVATLENELEDPEAERLARGHLLPLIPDAPDLDLEGARYAVVITGKASFVVESFNDRCSRYQLVELVDEAIARAEKSLT